MKLIPNDLIIKSSLDAGEIIVKLSSSTESTTSKSLSKATSQSTTTTTTTMASSGFESEPWVPLTPERQNSTVKVSSTNFVTSFSVEKSEEKSQQKFKPESPKLEATNAKIVDLEPPAKPERHLRPDTKAPKPEVVTTKPEVSKKEPEIKPDIKPKLAKV